MLSSSIVKTGKIRTEEICNISVEIFYSPRRKKEIVRTSHFIPPKFHLIPPKFHLIPPKNLFSPTWKIAILHVDILKFLRGDILHLRFCVECYTAQ